VWLAFQSEVISMSMFGLYFVRSLMHEAGWPRKQGLLRAEVFNTLIADQAVEQMIDWAAALGGVLSARLRSCQSRAALIH
jgi:hypothetical protein